jgi:hypothetical protein
MTQVVLLRPFLIDNDASFIVESLSFLVRREVLYIRANV